MLVGKTKKKKTRNVPHKKTKRAVGSLPDLKVGNRARGDWEGRKTKGRQTLCRVVHDKYSAEDETGEKKFNGEARDLRVKNGMAVGGFPSGNISKEQHSNCGIGTRMKGDPVFR